LNVSDELTSALELPASARAVSRARNAYERCAYEVRHPENHKQLVRFLCVGASGYIINLVLFSLLLKVVGVPDKLAFVLAALLAATSNFFWNRHWTFDAKQHHPAWQAVRFYVVSVFVLLFATGIYAVLLDIGLNKKIVADGIAWIIATPLSFVAQKLWSFKA
jgi:putative flippase GtrA